MPTTDFPCMCENCPSDPEKFSLCCQAETKIAAACKEGQVSCITKSGRLGKLWDKVRGGVTEKKMTATAV